MKEAALFTSDQPPVNCPACQTVLDATTGVSLNPANRRPTPAAGDVTCCAYCGVILAYTTDGLRLATDDDLWPLAPELRNLLFEFSATRTRARKS